MAAPQSTIYICKGVRLNHDYNHTIWFDSEADQMTYFAGKVVKPFLAYTYLRKTWSIKVDATLEEAREWSYLYFRNKGKFWYYFINNIEYINDSTVELFIEMDVIQSYLFDHTPLACLVEREHIANDSIGANLVEEGLETGEFMTITSEEVDLNDWYVMILATCDPAVAAQQDEIAPAFGSKIGNVFSGLGLYAFPLTEATALGTQLNQIDDKGHTECIVSMWMYPHELFTKGNASASYFYKVTGHASTFYTTERNSKLFDGYNPRNKKLFCHPYNFIYVSDNNGGAATFPYEFFGDSSNCVFNIVGSLSPEGAVRMYPVNFKNTTNNYEEGLSLANYPTCAWSSDPYKLWLAQNQNQQKLASAMAGIKMSAGAAAILSGGPVVAMGAGGVAFAGGLTEAANLLAQRADRDIQPPQAKGSFSSTVNMTAGFQTFTVKRKSIDRYHAEMIDGFFDMYGYKTNMVKVPNRNVREHWTYTKTVGCCISGDFCADDKAKIESIYNHGITFWKDGDMIGDYSENNPCIGG